MLKIGSSSNGKYLLTREKFAELQSAGIEAIEVCFGNLHNIDVNLSELSALSKEYGVELWSYHLPFVPYSELEPSSRENDIREKTVYTFSELIKRFADNGFSRFVVHASGEPIGKDERDERLKCAADSLSRLADVAEKCGGVVAVEDLPRTCIGRNSDEILYLLSANDKLRVCLDTNHLLGEPISSFISEVGNKIITLHVSDYDFGDERHWLPGEGMVDWIELYNQLIGVGYNGVWMYEVGYKTPKSIYRPYDLCPADLVRNAREIFAGMKPTSLGKPADNLAVWKE